MTYLLSLHLLGIRLTEFKNSGLKFSKKSQDFFPVVLEGEKLKKSSSDWSIARHLVDGVLSFNSIYNSLTLERTI